MYGQKRNGDPEEIRITVYKNDVREESKLLKLFGKQKEQPTSLNNYQAPSNQKAKAEKPGASFNPSPDHMSEPSEERNTNCRKHKTAKGRVCFPGYKLDAFKSRGSHKREE